MLGFSLTSRSFIRSTIATTADFDVITSSALFAEASGAGQARKGPHQGPPYGILRLSVAVAAPARTPALALPEPLRKR